MNLQRVDAALHPVDSAHRAVCHYLVGGGHWKKVVTEQCRLLISRLLQLSRIVSPLAGLVLLFKDNNWCHGFWKSSRSLRGPERRRLQSNLHSLVAWSLFNVFAS